MAGRKPKAMPTAEQNSSPMTAHSIGTLASKCVNTTTRMPSANPATTPITPPRLHRITAATRNWLMMLARRAPSIMSQFLVEAVILCNIGGVIGVVVGFALGNLVVVFTHFDANVPIEWAVIGLLFCSAVGIAFGFLPAMRAAQLDPIEALRYE